MSGHNKWANIKHRKGAADAKRGAVFSRHAKLITIAARLGGGDPYINPSLALAIERAKKENMPNANIERAIKSGTGELKDGAEISELIYEGFGPGKVSVMVSTLTDNKQRTVANIRHIFDKTGGSLGASGAVSWKFKKTGLITINKPTVINDQLELDLIECGADDLKFTDENIEVLCPPENINPVQKNLKDKNFSVEEACIAYVANEERTITDLEEAQKIIRFMDTLEEDEDVNEIYVDFVIAPTLLDKL